jgi:3-hydroxy-9,10-secoandrosta-1,3,5(10)-triene-9,17-dione monooxygenase
MGASVAEQRVPVPEPDLTPDELVGRAAGLREWLREEQDATEERGVHSPELNDAFTKAGFYRCLQPRMFGGYEFDIPTFYRMGLELARGCPSTGWCVTIGTGHALMLGSFFEEDAQAAAFGPDGHFLAPSVAAPSGRATPEATGWNVKGRWAYASGSPYSTHFMPRVLMPGPEGQEPPAGTAVLPRDQWTLLDDWGDILGLRGSGSNTIVVEDAHVPESHVVEIDMLDTDVSQGSHGTRLHGNPMYAARSAAFFHNEMVAIIAGLGWAAIDEYEHLMRTKNTIFPPFVPRYQSADQQRAHGLAIGMVHAAERLAIDGGRRIMEACRRTYEGGEPFSLEEDMLLFAGAEHGGRLVFEAVELLWRTASSSAAKNGQRLQRYYRDISMYRGHLSAQYEIIAQRLSQLKLGLMGEMMVTGEPKGGD